jgi:hypothetical protein
MIKLTKKTIQSGQVVDVIISQYKLCTISKDNPGFQPDKKLIAYKDLPFFDGPEVELKPGEQLEIIGLKKGSRAVTYKRLSDNEIYDSWLGSFTAFTRLGYSQNRIR